MPAVTVAGSYNQDLIFRTAALPRPGETLLGRMSVAHGGKGFNQAIAVSRLGADAVFIGAVGRDAAAASAAQFASANNLTCFFESQPQPTGTAVIICDDHGENQIVVAAGANAGLSTAHIDRHAKTIATSKVLLVQLECRPGAVARALQLARESHTLAIVNPAPFPDQPDWQLLRLANLLTPNETEFAALCRAADRPLPRDWTDLPLVELHAICRGLKLPDLVITLGANGGFYSLAETDSPGAFGRYAAPRVTAVDTTGAGDAFNGGLAAALAEGCSLVQALPQAAAVAAVAVTRAGAAPAMPNRQEAGWARLGHS